MIGETGYDLLMRRLGTRLFALFGGGLAVLLLAPSALPQAATTVASHGPAASVTSNFFGGPNDRAPGIPASVTSSGTISPHRGTPGQFVGEHGGTPRPVGSGEHHRHHRDHRSGDAVYYAVPYAVPVPYGSDYEDPPTQNAADDPEEDYRGGPTIFDRRGPGTPPSQDFAAQPASSDTAQSVTDPPAQAAPDRASDQPQTVVVFKDGHQLEMSNYAIVGDSLFDLTPGRRHKIALAELDLAATEKENDDRGIDFRLPAGGQGN